MRKHDMRSIQINGSINGNYIFYLINGNQILLHEDKTVSVEKQKIRFCAWNTLSD